MQPHLPFLKAIAADPADDLPRLVYADFLEESGHVLGPTWADFIRLHVEACQAGGTLGDNDRGRLAVLANRHLGSWLNHLRAAVPGIGSIRFDIVRWRGGFPDVLELPESGLDRVEDLFHVWPVQGLRLSGQYTFAGIETLPHLLKLVRLEVRVNQLPHQDDGNRGHRWVASPTLANVRSLRFTQDDWLSDEWLVEFVSTLTHASFAAGLSELDFSRCYQLSDAGANTLATARSLDRLRTLRLVGVPLSSWSITMLRNRFGTGLIV